MSNKFVNYLKDKFKNYPMHVTDYGVLLLADNMDILPKIMDRKFDLLLTDPPYGIKEDGKSNHSRGKGKTPEEHARRQAKAEARYYTPKDWDKEPPPPEYFQEVMRVTKNQIIFGGNYFQSIMIEDKKNYEFVYNHNGEQVVRYEKRPALGATPCWIVWDKDNGKTHFADCELAWTSFDTAVRKYEYLWNGMLQKNKKKEGDRFHPTQKPIGLMRMILRDYSKKGDRIIDTHSGSAPTAIASIDLKRYYLCIEKDKEYFDKSSEKIEYFKHGWNSKLTADDPKQKSQIGLEL